MGFLTGKAIVVTGAGRGIGAAIAAHAATAGATVVVNDIDADKAAEVADALVASGARAIADGADVRVVDQAEALIEACVRGFGRIDGLVNNAGLFHIARIEDETAEGLRAILETNVIGAFNCAKAAIRRMYAQRAGAIVNIVSGAQCGIEMMSAYGASKGALASITYAMALEAQGSGVRINAISPIAATRMSDVLNDWRREHGLPIHASPPAEANAPLVTYLLSDAAGAVHGQVVRVQGNRLSLMSHPAIAVPAFDAEAMSFEKVRDLFAMHLAARQFPPGLAAARLEITDLASQVQPWP